MNKKYIVIVGLVLVFLLGAVLMNLSRNKAEDLSGVQPTEDQSVYEDEIYVLGAEETVEFFLYNFFMTAPPDPDPGALTGAVSLVSEGARVAMGGSPTSSDLAAFVGVQDIPDEGFEIGDVVYPENAATGVEDEAATVEVTLMYSGGDTVRVFSLSKIRGHWLIDEISSP